MNAQSIGIIGGADGPTAIFVTSKFSWTGALLLAAGVIIGIVLVIRLLKKRK